LYISHKLKKILGQFVGGKLHNSFAKKMQDKISSCICVDLYKIITNFKKL